jgi:hypothetical protein
MRRPFSLRDDLLERNSHLGCELSCFPTAHFAIGTYQICQVHGHDYETLLLRRYDEVASPVRRHPFCPWEKQKSHPSREQTHVSEDLKNVTRQNGESRCALGEPFPLRITGGYNASIAREEKVWSHRECGSGGRLRDEREETMFAR